jgi:hypothetical protein
MSGPPSRRRFLAGLGLVGLTGIIAACSNAAPEPAPTTGPPTRGPTTTTTTPAPPSYTGDAASIAVCAAVAALAADLYGQAGSRAAQGRYGVVPGAVAGFLGTAAGQLTEHARAWNALLTSAGLPAVEGTPLTVESGLRARLEAARAPVDLVALAADLSTTVGATVTATTGRLADPTATAAVGLAAAVAPVVAMQGATASFLLGRPPAAPVDPVAGALGPEALTT